MRTFPYLMLILVPALVFTGCDPATQVEGQASESIVEEADVQDRMNAYYRHQLALMDYEAQSGKKGANSLTIAAFAHGTTVARGRSDAVSFSEAHSKAQKYLEKASGHPEAWNVGNIIGQTMLNWTIPYVVEDVPDNIKLDYVALLVQGMSTEFPTIVTTLEGVVSSEDRVIDLARRTLVNTYALEKIYLDDIDKHEGWLHGAQLTDDQKRQLEAHISALRTQWPPIAVIGEDDFSRSETDIEAIRARLKTLLGQ